MFPLRPHRRLLPFAACLLAAVPSPAQLITDELHVPPYVLPDVLRSTSGQTIFTAHEWEQIARPALLEKFQSHIYGKTPRADTVRLTTENQTKHEILGGKALLRQIRLRLRRGKHSGPTPAASFSLSARPRPFLRSTA